MPKSKIKYENNSIYITPINQNFLKNDFIHKKKHFKTKTSPKINKHKKVNNIEQLESLAIINTIKKNSDQEMLLVFYFLYVKGLNYTSISRILLTNFKNNFKYLILKKGKKSKYKIDFLIQPKLLEFMRNQIYTTKFFFLIM
jgi:hypothetical protein